MKARLKKRKKASKAPLYRIGALVALVMGGLYALSIMNAHLPHLSMLSQPEWWGEVEEYPGWWEEVVIEPLPRDKPFHEILLQIFRRYLGENPSFEERRKCLKALDALSKNLQGKSGEAKVIYHMGVQYMALGDWKRAIKEYRKVVEISPRDKFLCSRALQDMGEAYRKLEDPVRAREVYRFCLRYYPPLNPEEVKNLKNIFRELNSLIKGGSEPKKG